MLLSTAGVLCFYRGWVAIFRCDERGGVQWSFGYLIMVFLFFIISSLHFLSCLATFNSRFACVASSFILHSSQLFVQGDRSASVCFFFFSCYSSCGDLHDMCQARMAEGGYRGVVVHFSRLFAFSFGFVSFLAWETVICGGPSMMIVCREFNR